MTFSDDCLDGRSQLFTFDAKEQIIVDRKTFKQFRGLIYRSVDAITNIRHREVFLDCLNRYLAESDELDDADCFRASLLLDAYYEYVTASLAMLSDNLQEAYELIRGVRND
jgi:hypothetical protein